MMRVLVSLVAAILATLALTSCNSAERKASTSPAVAKVTPPAASKAASDGVRRITTVELQELINKGQAYVVDVRNEASYKQGHIPGAVLVPTNEVLKRANEFPRDKTIVTYCSWPAEQTSAGAVLNLKAKGIENAVALLGGFERWKEAGMPVAAGQ